MTSNKDKLSKDREYYAKQEYKIMKGLLLIFFISLVLLILEG